MSENDQYVRKYDVFDLLGMSKTTDRPDTRIPKVKQWIENKMSYTTPRMTHEDVKNAHKKKDIFDEIAPGTAQKLPGGRDIFDTLTDQEEVKETRQPLGLPGSQITEKLAAQAVKKSFPNLSAAGAALKDIPGQVLDLGDAIMSGVTGTLSERAEEAGLYLSRKLFGEGAPHGVTGAWEKPSKLPGYMKTAGELAGAVAPISLAGKTVAQPVIRLIAKSPHLRPFARIIGWGTAGATYEGVTQLLSEGELPTPGELAKYGAIWGSIEAGIGAVGWGGKLTVGVMKLARLWGIPKKEVLKIVITDAKSKGMPIASHVWAKAKVQKALSVKETGYLHDFVNKVDDIAKPFEKQGTYKDLVDQMKDQEITSRIKSFKTYAGKGTILGKKAKTSKRDIITGQESDVEKALLKPGYQRTAQEVMLINKAKGDIKYDPRVARPEKYRMGGEPGYQHTRLQPQDVPSTRLGALPGKDVPGLRPPGSAPQAAKIIAPPPKDLPKVMAGWKPEQHLKEDLPAWVKELGLKIRTGEPVAKPELQKYIAYFKGRKGQYAPQYKPGQAPAIVKSTPSKAEVVPEQSISSAYEKISKGAWNTRVRLSDLRAKLKDIPRDELDATLKKMQGENKLVLMGYDFKVEIKPADIKAAIEVGGDPAHIVYMRGGVKPVVKSTPSKMWRAETGYKHDKGTTAGDVVRHEQVELGNKLGVSKGEIKELDKYPATAIQWVTKTEKDALKYGKPGKVSTGKNKVIVATDGEGGFLVLDKIKASLPPNVLPVETLAVRQVKQAALLYPDGKIVTGQTHMHCLENAEKLGFVKTLDVKGAPSVKEGFVDAQGKFMTRAEAKAVAGSGKSEDLIESGVIKPQGVTLGFGATGELQRIYERLIARLSHKPEGAVKIGDVTPKEPTDLVKRMTQALSGAKQVRGQQETIYQLERAKKLARMVSVGKETSGQAGFREEVKALGGKMTKAEFESFQSQFSEAEVNSLFDMVKNCPTLSLWETIPARKGLAKMFGEFGGTVPTEGELKLLREVFGDSFVVAAEKARPFWTRAQKMGLDLISMPKALMASFDLSAPLRQGIFFVGRPKQFLPAFRDMFKYFASPKYYESTMQKIRRSPAYDLAMKHKLDLTEMGTVPGKLSKREEAFMSSYAERIPIIGRGVRASSQAFSGFLNQLRFTVFEDFVKKGAQLGLKDPKFLNDATKFINTATGRGSLGKFEGAAVHLNAAFFSPRLVMSRLQLLSPRYYIKMEPHVRKEALKSLFAFASIATTVGSLAALNSVQVGFDPRNADFMKLKFGNTRYDILGGFQQPIRLAAQMLSGEIISSTTGKTLTLGEGYKPITRVGIAGRFIEYKQAPVASFVFGLLRGVTAIGEKFDIPTEISMRGIPMFIQDMCELYNEEGLAGIPMVAPAMFGVGVQTYGGVGSYGLKGKNWPQLNAELDRLQIPMGFPATTAFGQELSDKEFYNYRDIAGVKIARELTKLMQKPYYKKAADNERKFVMAKVADKIRSEVKFTLYPDKKIISQVAQMVKQQQQVTSEEALEITKALMLKKRRGK